MPQNIDLEVGRSRRLEPGGRPLPITTVAGWGVATDTTARLAGAKVQFGSHFRAVGWERRPISSAGGSEASA